MDEVSYLVESGVIANDKPLRALEAGEHFWVIRGTWHALDPQSVVTQRAIVLNDETVVRVDGPACLFCGLDYSEAVAELIPNCSGVQK